MKRDIRFVGVVGRSFMQQTLRCVLAVVDLCVKSVRKLLRGSMTSFIIVKLVNEKSCRMSGRT